MDICIYVRKAGLGSSLTGQCRCPFFYVLVKTSTLFLAQTRSNKGKASTLGAPKFFVNKHRIGTL